MKLQLFLSHNGIASRRKAFEAIFDGAVTVNGTIVKEPSFEVDPSKDKVTYKNQPVAAKRFEYIVMNKPVGYVTTCEGQFDQRTVIQLLPRELSHLRPVGRLDKDSEGLLILTNDGWLANRLMHPSFDVDKTYYVRVRWNLTPEKVRLLEGGIIVEGEKTAPASVRVLRTSERESEFEITIHEGKKRQIRIMLNEVGNPVVQLRRLRQGPVEIGNLRSSEWRRLTANEVDGLKRIRPQAEGEAEFEPQEEPRREFQREERRGPREGRPPFKGPRSARPGSFPRGEGRSREERGVSRGARPSFGPKKYPKPNFGFRPPRPEGEGRSEPSEEGRGRNFVPRREGGRPGAPRFEKRPGAFSKFYKDRPARPEREGREEGSEGRRKEFGSGPRPEGRPGGFNKFNKFSKRREDRPFAKPGGRSRDEDPERARALKPKYSGGRSESSGSSRPGAPFKKKSPWKPGFSSKGRRGPKKF